LNWNLLALFSAGVILQAGKGPAQKLNGPHPNAAFHRVAGSCTTVKLKRSSIRTAVLCSRSGLAAAALLLMSSCATLNVPAEPPRFDPTETQHASAPGVELGVKPILEREEYWSLFDDNLPEAGIAAVWVSVKNLSDREIDFSGVRWVLRRGMADQAALTSDQVFKIYYRARHIRMYAAETDRRARLAMERVRFQPGSIHPSAERDGFLFFHVYSSALQEWTGRGTLCAENVRLNDGITSSLQVHFTHANP
jgi:hypothetical protein